MMLGARTAAWSGKRLPYDAEVEYLESTGTQWIDTGVNGHSLITSDIGVMRLSSSINECAVGCWNDPSTRCWLAYFYHNNLYGGHGEYAQSFVEYSPDTWHRIKTEISGNRYMYILDGAKYQFHYNEYNSNQNIYLFAMNNFGTPNYYSNVRISHAKLFDNGVIVREYIPVRVGDVGYTYDRVTGELFGNAGTGAFIIGPDKTT